MFSPFPEALKTGNIDKSSATVIARMRLALAVKKGAPKPDISSVEAFKKTLVSAKAIAHGDPAQGGAASQHVAQMLEKLGIAELKGKTKLFAPAGGKGFPEVAAEMLQKGESDIALLPISELQRVQGIDIVGPLPAELQSPDLTFFAGTPWSCEHPLEAKAFVDFLRSDQAKEVYKAKGLEPVKPAASG
jgi:molybdate transport system substrate-binding protein